MSSFHGSCSSETDEPFRILLANFGKKRKIVLPNQHIANVENQSSALLESDVTHSQILNITTEDESVLTVPNLTRSPHNKTTYSKKKYEHTRFFPLLSNLISTSRRKSQILLWNCSFAFDLYIIFNLLCNFKLLDVICFSLLRHNMPTIYFQCNICLWCQKFCFQVAFITDFDFFIVMRYIRLQKHYQIKQTAFLCL